MFGWIEIHNGHTYELAPDPERPGSSISSQTLSPGDTCRWVRATECRLADGTQAFQDSIDRSAIPPPPEWFSAPPGSTLHDSMVWVCWPEARSMQASCEEVLAFYEELAVANGLVVQGSIEVGRRSSWVSPSHTVLHMEALSEDFRFDLVVYGYKGTAFWTTQFFRLTGMENFATSPGYLVAAGEAGDRLLLRDQWTGKEFWAPLAALVDTRPPEPAPKRPPEPETILWDSLPEWVQFTLEPGSQGELRRHADVEDLNSWEASITVRHDGCHVCIFEACIETLNARGFATAAAEGTYGTYYVSSFQEGASLNLHVQSTTGERCSVCSLNTLGNMSLSLRYAKAGIS
ncbi:MAG TPA: hypothetical protein VGN16_08845 [Acidobacteriaceae bacterium]